jgi:tRNA (cmo5U34)-methyltransferase
MSTPMMEVAAELLCSRDVDVEVMHLDLTRAYPTRAASLTLCVLTLQFISVTRRLELLRQVCGQTIPGGAIIVVEKVAAVSPDLDAHMTEVYHRIKISNGYSLEDVRRKHRALDGVLVPLSAAANELMLRKAGFGVVDCFWRWLNFAGWVGVKA